MEKFKLLQKLINKKYNMIRENMQSFRVYLIKI